LLTFDSAEQFHTLTPKTTYFSNDDHHHRCFVPPLALRDRGASVRIYAGDTSNDRQHLLDDSDMEEEFWKISKNPPAQRCYSFSCHQDELSSVKWNRMQENAWFVFYDDIGCNGNYIRVFDPEDSLRPGDSGLDNRLESFMLWNSRCT
jgi:hypothetical protein